MKKELLRSRCVFLLTGNPEDNTITLTKIFDGEEPVSTRMVPRPFLQGTVEQSLINSKFRGSLDFVPPPTRVISYYHEDLADRYDQWMERIRGRKKKTSDAGMEAGESFAWQCGAGLVSGAGS